MAMLFRMVDKMLALPASNMRALNAHKGPAYTFRALFAFQSLWPQFHNSRTVQFTLLGALVLQPRHPKGTNVVEIWHLYRQPIVPQHGILCIGVEHLFQMRTRFNRRKWYLAQPRRRWWWWCQRWRRIFWRHILSLLQAYSRLDLSRQNEQNEQETPMSLSQHGVFLYFSLLNYISSAQMPWTSTSL